MSSFFWSVKSSSATYMALAENATLMGNVECINIGDGSESKTKVENMEVSDNSINKDVSIQSPQSKEGRHFEPDIRKEENEPDVDEPPEEDFLDSMAVVDVWNPDCSDESDTENRGKRRDDLKHINSVSERHKSDRNPDDRSRNLKRESRDRKSWDDRIRQDRNNRGNSDRQNRSNRDRSIDRNWNDRDRQKRNSRNTSIDKNLSVRERENRNSRERNTDRERQKRNSRNRSTDKDLINKERVNRTSRERSTDRERQKRNDRNRNTDINRERINRASRERSTDRERQKRSSRDRSWNNRHRHSRDRSTDRETYRHNWNRNTDRYQRREVGNERKERNSEQSSKRSDKVENTVYKYRERRNEESSDKTGERSSSRGTQGHRDESKDITGSLERRKSQDIDLRNKDKILEEVTDRKNSTPVVEVKGNVPKLDTCIKALDDLLPPGTEDEFILPLRDESIKLTEELQKIKGTSGEKQDSDKVLCDNDAKDSQQRREIKRVLQSGRDYKNDKWEDRRNRLNYDNEADRKQKRTDYRDDGRRIQRSDRETKRALSKDRESSRSSSKQSRVKHRENLSDSERNIKFYSRDKQYRDSSVKYNEYRRSAIRVGNKKVLHRGRSSKDRERDLSPVSDFERLSTPTLSSEFSPVLAEKERRQSYDRKQRYGHAHSYSPVHRFELPRSLPCFCSRSRSLDSCSTLSSDLSYNRRRKRSPFLKELEQKLAKNANSQLTNFSFAAVYQNPSNQDFGGTNYPAPAVYPMTEVHPPASFDFNYPPPVPDYSQSYMPQTPHTYFSEPSAMPPNYSDASTVQMQALQPVQMPEQFPVPPHMQLLAPPPSQPAMPLPMQSPSQMMAQSHVQLSMPPPSQQSTMLFPPVQSPSQMMVQPHVQLSVPSPVQLLAQPHMLQVQTTMPDVSVPPPSQLPVQTTVPDLSIPPPSQLRVVPVPSPVKLQVSKPTTISPPLAPASYSQSYDSPKLESPTMQAGTSLSENVSERKVTKNEKSKRRNEPAPDVPPPPKISRLYSDKVSLSRLLETSMKVAVPSTKEETSVDPALITRCEDALFALQSASDPSFLTPGPLVVQDTSRASTELQYIPAHLRNYQSPLLRKPDIQLNFTNRQLFEDIVRVPSEIAATSATGFNENSPDSRVYQSKRNVSNVKVPKQSNSSSNESKCPDSNVKESTHYNVKDSKHYSVKDSKICAKEQKNCSACLERANKIMIWNCTQTPKVNVRSIGVQVSVPGSHSEHSFAGNSNWNRSDLGEASAAGSSKNLYASEEYRQFCDEEESSLTPSTLQKGSRQLFSSGSYGRSPNSLSLDLTPRKGILKSSGSSSTQEQSSSQFSYRQMQSSLSTDFKALQSLHGVPSSRVEHYSDMMNKLTDLHDKDLPRNKPLPSTHSYPNIPYSLRPFRSSGGEYGGSYDRNNLTSESRFESSLPRSQSPSAFPGKSTSFDYHHSDRPTPFFSDPSSCL